MWGTRWRSHGGVVNFGERKFWTNRESESGLVDRRARNEIESAWKQRRETENTGNYEINGHHEICSEVEERTIAWSG
jgi:hypothetical protein